VLRDLGKRLVDRERLFEQRHRLLAPCQLELFVGRGPLAGRGAQCDRCKAGGSSWASQGRTAAIVAETVEMLVRAREHFLEDVLSIGVREPEGLDGDRGRRNGRICRRASAQACWSPARQRATSSLSVSAWAMPQILTGCYVVRRLGIAGIGSRAASVHHSDSRRVEVLLELWRRTWRGRSHGSRESPRLGAGLLALLQPLLA